MVSGQTHKEADFAPASNRWSCAPVGDAEKFPQAIGYESLGPLLRVNTQGPCLTAIERGGSDKRLVQLELACKADSVASPDPT